MILQDSILLIDKPYKWTSFDVVKKIRYWGDGIKVGHIGTLDPLATGLLVLCTGEKTKESKHLVGMDKEYICEFFLGYTTPTFDLESIPLFCSSLEWLQEKDVYQAARYFEGQFFQLPPIYSAIKQEGVRLYRKARNGEDIQLSLRSVCVHSFVIESITWPIVRARITLLFWHLYS